MRIFAELSMRCALWGWGRDWTRFHNFVAHRAFGKQGEAFHFHSTVGAVPVMFYPTKSSHKFSLTEELGFDDAEALASVEEFVADLWSGSREPARKYIQDTSLPIIYYNGERWAIRGSHAIC
jgi:hypothetical protein